MHRLLLSALFGSIFLFLASGESAAVFYGPSFSSPTGTVAFLNVSDDFGLYGPPSVSGNTLDFNPTLFEIDCPNAGASCPPATADVIDTLVFEIDADPGFFIEEVVLTEAGDTFISDNLVPIGFAATTVTAEVFIDIFELDNVAVSGINGSAFMTFTAGGQFDTTTSPNGAQIWSGFLSLDVDALIAAAGQTGRATLVEISLSNRLTAYAENGGVASIEKKDVDGLAITVVPEPGTAIILGLGLMLLSHRQRDTQG